MPRLHLDQVHFAFGAREVLHGVSLSVAAGECLAVLGPNGAGKSTLLRVASGYLAPSAGSVRLDGEDLARLPRRAAARRIAGVSAHESFELPFRVREAVLLGRLPWRGAFGALSPSDEAAVEAALAAADLTALAERVLPSLSSGERQRVALARALVQRPDVLLLDEPTAHLDLGQQVRTLDVVRAESRARGVAVLAVLHDVNLAGGWADRIALLDGGRLVEEGAPARVLSGNLLAEVFGAAIDRVEVPGRAAPLIVPRGERR